MTDPLTGYVRVKAICVFTNVDRILAIDGYDPTKQQRFWVPVGGRVELGETSSETIVREVREELSATVTDLTLLGVLENIFTFDGGDGHEILFVYDGRFVDSSFYVQPVISGVEDNGEEFEAHWIDPALPDHGWPLYPNGLPKLLTSHG